MADEATESTQSQELGLIVQQPGKAEQTRAKFLKLLLSYKYGLPTQKIQDDYTRVSGIIRKSGEAIRCVVVIQRQAVSARSTIPVLGAKGTIPLFLLLPGYVAQEQSEECAELENVFVCSWEMAFITGQGLLQQLIASGLQSQQDDEPGSEGGPVEFEERLREHAVSCALVVDKMVEQELVTLAQKVEYNEYWVAALLHDCGKMIQGFFFWEWFERIVRTMESDNSTFHEAENELSGGMVSHESIGELLLQKSNMPPELVAAVGLHHATCKTPPPLVALIHVANNITKEIGLGYIEDEPVQYTDGAFKALKIGPHPPPEGRHV